MDVVIEVAFQSNPRIKLLMKLAYKDLYNKIKIREIPNNNYFSSILTRRELRLFPDLYILNISSNKHLLPFDINKNIKILIMRNNVLWINEFDIENFPNLEVLDIIDNDYFCNIWNAKSNSLKRIITSINSIISIPNWNGAITKSSPFPNLHILEEYNRYNSYELYNSIFQLIKCFPKLHYYSSNNDIGWTYCDDIKEIAKRNGLFINTFVNNNKKILIDCPFVIESHPNIPNLKIDSQKCKSISHRQYIKKIFPRILRSNKLELKDLPSIVFSIKRKNTINLKSYHGIVKKCLNNKKKYKFEFIKLP